MENKIINGIDYIKFISQELFTLEKSSHPGETSYWVRSCQNGVFQFVKTNRLYENGFIPPMWDLTSTQVRYNDFSPCKQFLLGCPT